MRDFVKEINDFGEPINRTLKARLNKFFKKYPDYAEGCILRKDWERADYALIIESSYLHEFLNYGYSVGWTVHSDFHDAFKDSGFFPEMQNSCVVGFYRD
jgi:hypothetical protein